METMEEADVIKYSTFIQTQIMAMEAAIIVLINEFEKKTCVSLKDIQVHKIVDLDSKKWKFKDVTVIAEIQR